MSDLHAHAHRYPVDHLPHLAERRRLREVLRTRDELVANKRAAREVIISEMDSLQEKLDLLETEFDEKIDAFDKHFNAVVLGGPEHEWQVSDFDEDLYLSLCSLTDLPIHDDDEVIQDKDAGIVVIKAVLFPDLFPDTDANK